MAHNQISDSTLVSLYKNGDEKAFETLVHRHKAKVYTTILLIVKDHFIAEDLLQDTFIKAIKTIKTGKYNEEGKFLPWITRIAHNLAIDYFRKEKRYPKVLLEEGANVLNTLNFSEDSIEAAQIKKETYSKLRVLIQKLPEKQREVLIMRHYAEMSFQEIANATNVSVNTALGRMRYALINLRKQMNKYKITYDKNVYPK
ncbi:RNA polymerase sigma factor [Microscilla marina]|uniref:RNA polymerase sigma-70 factor, ECF subfamily n=1 Tax=Microscilla marina ATCC 23134 TaxID=313606 RepID=A1ZFN7_MICM2|nr:sigma-70 family RNA polymerase sigma factor [Microscilla marina]EAY30811.1 RNA polymerase sigma-70 factor, ECF subfamily [Microscilla marina ATCC 23134]